MTIELDIKKLSLSELDELLREAVRAVETRSLPQKQRQDAMVVVAETVRRLTEYWHMKAHRSGVIDSKNFANDIAEQIVAVASVQLGQLDREEVEAVFAKHGKTLPSMRLLDKPNSVLQLGSQLVKGAASRTAFLENREHQDAVTIKAQAALRRKKGEQKIELRQLSATLSSPQRSCSTDQVFGVEQRIEVKQAISSLPKRQAFIVLGRHGYGIGVQQLASQLNVSTETIRRELRAAEAALERLLAPDCEQVRNQVLAGCSRAFQPRPQRSLNPSRTFIR